jgi:hypothetical protein
MVTVDKASERVDLELHRIGGLSQCYTISRPVRRYDLRSDYPRLVEPLRALCAERNGAAVIAEHLNAEGFRPPKRVARLTGQMVQRLICQLGLTRRHPHGSCVGLGRDGYWPAGLARRLSISRDTVRRWLRAG